MKMFHSAPFSTYYVFMLILCNFQVLSISSLCHSKGLQILPNHNLNWSYLESESAEFICNSHFNQENYGLLYWDEEGFQKVLLNGTLKVAVWFVDSGSIYQARMPNGSTKGINGYASVPYALILDLQFIFNFKIEFIPSQGWIEKGENDTITGVGYQITSGEADIGIDISRPVIYRAKHLQFLHPVRQDKITIVFRQPNVPMYRNILLRPFKGGLWKGAVAAWFVLFLSIAFIARKRLLPMFVDFHNLFLPVTAIVLARTTNMNTLLQTGNVGRSLFIVILVSSWFGLMMYSIYSAFIVSSLRRMNYPVKTFRDLIDYNYELVASSSLPDFASIYVGDEWGEQVTKLATSNFKSVETSLTRLFEGSGSDGRDLEDDEDDEDEYNGIAWFVLKSDFTSVALQHGYSSKQICEINSLDPVKRAQRPRVLSMYIQQGNRTLKEHFNRKILDVLGKGLGSRERCRFEKEYQPNCNWRKRRRGEATRIRIYDVYAAYYVLVGGAGIALIVAILERISSWMRQEK